MTYKFRTTAQRSQLMSKIKSDKTNPEVLLQKAFRKKGIIFKKNYSRLPGVPDIVMLDRRVAVFVDGEFWHGYQWKKKKKRIKSNRSYWIPKIEKTILRDRRNNRKLKKEGWKVFRIWENQIKKDLPACLEKIIVAMKTR